MSTFLRFSNFLIRSEKCPYCIGNGFMRDYLVVEQTREQETNDEFDTRLYIFVGVYYLELGIEKKECSCIPDSIKCDNYFVLNDRIMKFMKILEFHMRKMQIMKIIVFQRKSAQF